MYSIHQDLLLFFSASRKNLWALLSVFQHVELFSKGLYFYLFIHLLSSSVQLLFSFSERFLILYFLTNRKQTASAPKKQQVNR